MKVGLIEVRVQVGDPWWLKRLSPPFRGHYPAFLHSLYPIIRFKLKYNYYDRLICDSRRNESSSASMEAWNGPCVSLCTSKNRDDKLTHRPILEMLAMKYDGSIDDIEHEDRCSQKENQRDDPPSPRNASYSYIFWNLCLRTFSFLHVIYEVISCE
jgi:hypothetical protein